MKNEVPFCSIFCWKPISWLMYFCSFFSCMLVLVVYSDRERRPCACPTRLFRIYDRNCFHSDWTLILPKRSVCYKPWQFCYLNNNWNWMNMVTFVCNRHPYLKSWSPLLIWKLMQMGCVMCHDGHCSSGSQAHEQLTKRGFCRRNLKVLLIRSELKTSNCGRPQSATQQGRHWNTNKLGFIHFGICSKNFFRNSNHSIWSQDLVGLRFWFVMEVLVTTLKSTLCIGGWRKWLPNSFHFGIKGKSARTLSILDSRADFAGVRQQIRSLPDVKITEGFQFVHMSACVLKLWKKLWENLKDNKYARGLSCDIQPVIQIESCVMKVYQTTLFKEAFRTPMKRQSCQA